MVEEKICPIMSRPVDITQYGSKDDPTLGTPVIEIHYATRIKERCAAWGKKDNHGDGVDDWKIRWGARLIP